MTAPGIPALVFLLVLAVGASLAAGPSGVHSSHHPQEQSGTERAFATVADALARRWRYPR